MTENGDGGGRGGGRRKGKEGQHDGERGKYAKVEARRKDEEEFEGSNTFLGGLDEVGQDEVEHVSSEKQIDR